nr:hypothetical protein CFP56_32952 [Quercus suber]
MDTRTKLRTYGRGTKAVNAVRWMLRRRVEPSSELSTDLRRLINDEAANALAPTAMKWRQRTREQSYAPMIVEREQ